MRATGTAESDYRPVHRNVHASPADLRDQRWLDERIGDIENGVDAAIEIARNWTDGFRLGRLHPAISPADYIRERVGALRLGKAEITVLLAETNWSNRQIAVVAGVSEGTVRNVATAQEYAVDRPATTLGADGKLRPARVVREVVAEVLEPDEHDVHPQGDDPHLTADAVEAKRPTWARRESANASFLRWTRWYLDAVNTYTFRRDPQLGRIYGPAVKALEAAILPELIHGARLEVGRRQRALERAVAGRLPTFSADIMSTEERTARDGLARAEERLAKLIESGEARR